jgi:hypothetical protein
MSKVPETDGGLTEEEAIQAGEMLRQGWDVLRSLEFNPKASILRYTKTEGRPDLGIPPTETLIEGFADLDVYVSDVNMREVFASRGLIEITDKLFVFYTEVKETDQILYRGKTYNVVQIRLFDPGSGRCHAIGRTT